MTLSNPNVHKSTWVAALIALAVVLIGGLGLAAVLSQGAADPPYDGLVNLDIHPQGTTIAPFTLQTAASGFDLTCVGATPLHILVRRDGYFSVTAGEPDWQEFIHINRERNVLYWHVDSANHVEFRINGEIAWTGQVSRASCTYQRMSDG